MLPRRAVVVAACVAGVLAGAGRVLGDEIVKTDGTRLSGRVVGETATHVSFEVSGAGMTVRQRIARGQIRSVVRERREGPGYCPLPIVGVIGEDVLARDVEAGVRAARQAGPRYVVLVIDSPGGAIDEMNKIVGVIAANPDLTFVAYVKGRAISAAAIVAMTCPRIYLAPDASIGACVPYGIGPDGTPVAVEEKWESAIRAQMRAAARVGGHDELWLRAMTELDAEISALSEADGRIRLAVRADAPEDARVVKRNGQILTLTGPEAAALGLAAGVAATLDDVRQHLGHDAWHASDDRAAWQLMEDRARTARAELNRTQAAAQKRYAERRYVESAAPEVRRLDDQITRVLARGLAAEQELTALKRDFEQRLATLTAERDAAVRSATTVQGRARANDSFRVRRHELALEYRPRVTELSTRLRESAAEAEVLLERRKALLPASASAE